jgi:hypothetical protein
MFPLALTRVGMTPGQAVFCIISGPALLFAIAVLMAVLS